MTEELQEQLCKFIIDYINRVGLEEFKKTSFFMSIGRS